MPTKEEYLKELGLSPYEIRVYLTLLKSGPSKANDVSKNSGVPYGRVYDVLYSLEQGGIISVIPSKPKVFEALEPKVAIKILLEKKKTRFEKLEKEWEEVEKRFKPIIPSIKTDKEESVSVYYGSEAAIKLGRAGIEKTEKEMLINTTRLEDALAQKLILKKVSNGVKTRIMISEVTSRNMENIKKIQKMGGLIKIGGIRGMKLGITDEKATLITVTNPKNLKGFITIIVQGRNFAKAMKDFFNSKWKTAKNIFTEK